MHKEARLIIILLLILSFVPGAHAWKITPALEKEIAEKQKAVEDEPYHPHAHFDLAVTYGYTNHILDGWDELRKVNELDPKYAPVALRKYQRLARANPKDIKIHFRLAFALYFNQKKRDALKEFQGILKLDPQNIWAMGYVATAYGDLDQVDNAIHVLNQALRIDSEVAVLHYLLGQAYSRKGDNWGSVRETGEALRLKALGF